MGSSVEIYVKYAGEGQGLAHRVAQDLGVVSYFYSGDGYVLPADARRWIGVEGWGQLGLDQTDLGRTLAPDSNGVAVDRLLAHAGPRDLPVDPFAEIGVRAVLVVGQLGEDEL